jgi:hypothetical protein
MKILGRIPYDASLNVPFRRCDLCDASEYDDIAKHGPASSADFIPMFRVEEDFAEYVVCATCVEKEAEAA